VPVPECSAPFAQCLDPYERPAVISRNLANACAEMAVPSAMTEPIRRQSHPAEVLAALERDGLSPSVRRS